MKENLNADSKRIAGTTGATSSEALNLFALIQTRDYRMWLEGREGESPIALYKRMREEYPKATVYIIKGDYAYTN